ncbi:vesicle transport through interaction with t-SNAREs 1a isoform X4 [Tachypleus tridentatus]|uniref:vesicle transport through interaction with t-SNAREs 1a isoform X4 n=1 Tax=Tachypleus tridentatus TaxID=6853 RepID=UPI003FD572EE
MASLMESFEQQYASLTADITGKTGKIPNLTGLEKKKMVLQVEKHMEEAQELVEQMELEIRTLTAAEQLKYRNHVKNYLTELKQMHKELQRAKIAFCDEVLTREELFESEDTSIAEDKQRLLDNTERLERSSRKLQAGYGLALETEQIGADVLNSLYSQRETIKKSRDRLRETDDDLGKSSRILSGMIRSQEDYMKNRKKELP